MMMTVPEVPSSEILNISVRLRPGVLRKHVDSRISELLEVIANSNDRVFTNFRPFELDCASQEITSVLKAIENLHVNSDSLPPLSSLIYSVTFGTLSVHDGLSFKINTDLKCTNINTYIPAKSSGVSSVISADENDEESAVIGSLNWDLPCETFEGLWESLHYEDNVKLELLSYVLSLIRLNTAGIDRNVVTVNGLILLTGPPGTGKTSLCTALAQKLSIILRPQFAYSYLIEVNAHSLFSKWFSESGKLVMKLFEHVKQTADDLNSFIFLMIDEVESLSMARTGSISRGDPADSVRAVNALLTQIDDLRRRPNVFVMCTSNMRECLDEAFVDRADFIRVISNPGPFAFVAILRECILEMEKRDFSDGLETQLLNLAQKYHDVSGRSLRKIPAVAYSKCMKKVVPTSEFLTKIGDLLESRLQAFEATIQK